MVVAVLAMPIACPATSPDPFDPAPLEPIHASPVDPEPDPGQTPEPGEPPRPPEVDVGPTAVVQLPARPKPTTYVPFE